MFDLVSPPTEVPQAPARIVLGMYLRGLREEGHHAAGRGTRSGGAGLGCQPVGACEYPIPLGALRTLLCHFGVAGKHADCLAVPSRDGRLGAWPTGWLS